MLHKPKQIVDINCGRNSHLKHFISGDCHYYGNDIDAIEYNSDRKIVEKIDELSVIGRLEELGITPDVITYLGDGIGDINPNGLESENGRAIVVEAIIKYNPKIVVHEAVQKYENENGILSHFCMDVKSLGYRKRFDVSLDIGEDRRYFVNFRRMCVYDR
jgi:hypothetical protein